MSIRTSFQIVHQINPVWGDWNPSLDLDPSCNVVDIQLVEGDLIEDREFITEYSQEIVSLQDGSIRHRYCSLEDRLASDEFGQEHLKKIRTFIKELVCNPGPIENVFLFFAKVMDEKDECFPEENYYQIRAYWDEIDLNGGNTIFVIERDEIDFYLSLFCHWDSVKVVSLPKSKVRKALSKLSLADPIPTTMELGDFPISQKTSSLPLEKILEEGDFFMEEVDNGTRLRVVSKTMGEEKLQGEIRSYEKKFRSH